MGLQMKIWNKELTTISSPYTRWDRSSGDPPRDSARAWSDRWASWLESAVWSRRRDKWRGIHLPVLRTSAFATPCALCLPISSRGNPFDSSRAVCCPAAGGASSQRRCCCCCCWRRYHRHQLRWPLRRYRRRLRHGSAQLSAAVVAAATQKRKKKCRPRIKSCGSFFGCGWGVGNKT